jgi:hypothetical protein
MSHSVRVGRAISVLLEEDWAKSGVEGTDTFVFENLPEPTDQTSRKTRCRDKADASSLERAKSNRGEELGATSRYRVDECAILTGFINTKDINGLLLEELITTKLERALHEISSTGRAKPSCKSANTFILDNLAEAADHTTIVSGRVELDPGLHTREEVLVDGGWARDDGTVHVDWSECTVGDGAAQCTSKSKTRVKIKTLGFLLYGRGALDRCSRGDGSHCEGGVERARSDTRRWAVTETKIV